MLLWIGEVGYYFDLEMGLLYVRARIFGPTIARWTAVDPLSNLRALLRYIYAEDTPLYPSHLGHGDRVDFVEPRANGPVLGYSHQGVVSMLRRRRKDKRPMGEGTNLYGYALNNPIRYADASGLAVLARFTCEQIRDFCIEAAEEAWVACYLDLKKTMKECDDELDRREKACNRGYKICVDEREQEINPKGFWQKCWWLLKNQIILID